MHCKRTDSFKQRLIQLKTERQWMHSVARCGQRSVTMILMAVVAATLRNMNSSQKGGRNVRMCKCGSTTHQCINHSDCPLNEKIKKSGVSVDDRASENSDFITLKIPHQMQKAFL